MYNSRHYKKFVSEIEKLRKTIDGEDRDMIDSAFTSILENLSLIYKYCDKKNLSCQELHEVQEANYAINSNSDDIFFAVIKKKNIKKFYGLLDEIKKQTLKLNDSIMKNNHAETGLGVAISERLLADLIAYIDHAKRDYEQLKKSFDTNKGETALTKEEKLVLVNKLIEINAVVEDYDDKIKYLPRTYDFCDLINIKNPPNEKREKILAISSQSSDIIIDFIDFTGRCCDGLIEKGTTTEEMQEIYSKIYGPEPDYSFLDIPDQEEGKAPQLGE